MSKFMFIMIAAIMASSPAFAQPVLTVQDTVDWGQVVPDVPPGETAKVSADVTLTNEGNETLNITEVRPGCGCTNAPLDKSVLEPGESTEMHVTLNLPLSNGLLQKRITIQANDEKGAHVVWLKADVQRPLQASSSFFPFNKGKVGEPIEGAVTFKVFGKEAVTLTAESTDDGIKVVTPMPLTIEPGTSADLVVSYTPTKAGPFTVDVEVKTSLAGYSSFPFKGYGAADEK